MSKAPAIFPSSLGLVLASLLLIPSAVRANDLVTLSGAVYHDVRFVRAEPDGVIWQHAGGICKVDFQDSPPAIREAYHYDAASAAAFKAEQGRRQEEAKALLQANEQRQLARAQSAMTSADVTNASERGVTFRRAASPAASEATRALASQFAAEDAKRAAEAANSGTVLGAPGVWSIVPHVSAYRPDRSFEVSNADEYKASLHHSASEGAVDSFHDTFLTPIYMTKSYDEDVERAAAFSLDP